MNPALVFAAIFLVAYIIWGYYHFFSTKVPRLFGWQVATVLLGALIYFLAPQQLPVSLYKLSLVTMGGVVGYWLDRALFPYARPDSFIRIVDMHRAHVDGPIFQKRIIDDNEVSTLNTAMLRRAIIVAAVMIAIGLGA